MVAAQLRSASREIRGRESAGYVRDKRELYQRRPAAAWTSTAVRCRTAWRSKLGPAVCGTWRRTPPEVAGSQEIGRALDTRTSQTHVRSDPSRRLGHFLAVFDHTWPRLRSFPGPGAQPVSGAGAPSLAQFCPGPGRAGPPAGPAQGPCSQGAQPGGFGTVSPRGHSLDEAGRWYWRGPPQAKAAATGDRNRPETAGAVQPGLV